jgi:hypothetical protein
MGFDSDVFGYKRNPKPHGVFSTEDSTLIFGGEGATIDAAVLGYLVQNWSVSYAQQVQELFEIGSNALYWAKGRPVGQGVLGRVIGAQDATTPSAGFFPKSAYDICDGGATMVLNAKGGACPTPPVGGVTLDRGVKITMSGVVVTSIGFSMQIADVRLMEQFAWRFAYMALGTGKV